MRSPGLRRARIPGFYNSLRYYLGWCVILTASRVHYHYYFALWTNSCKSWIRSCYIPPENLEVLLQKVCDLARGHFATERPLGDVVDCGTQLELELNLVICCCNFVRNHLQRDPYVLRPLFSELKRQAEAARRSFALDTACDSRYDRDRLPLQGNTVEEPFQIPKDVSVISAPSSRSALTSAIEGAGLFPRTFGLASTKVRLFNECKVTSDTEADWKRHDEIQHGQQALWICSKADCRAHFFHDSINLENHLREHHGKTGDLTEEIRQWHVRRNHQQSFFCPHCDKVIHHGREGLEATDERFVIYFRTSHLRD
jgi:hypothetical protein